MRQISEVKLRRIIDANFNRVKEGLRVCEDICRFVLDLRGPTRALKDLRHEVQDILVSSKIKELVLARATGADVGRGSSSSELKRRDITDVFGANIQRVKESVRVLEELMKLYRPQDARKLKHLRYKAYAIEKKVIAQL